MLMCAPPAIDSWLGCVLAHPLLQAGCRRSGKSRSAVVRQALAVNATLQPTPTYGAPVPLRGTTQAAVRPWARWPISGSE